MRALDELLKRKALTSRQIAKEAGVSMETVRLWRLGKRKIAVGRLGQVARITGLTPHDLRPDVFGPDELCERGAA